MQIGWGDRPWSNVSPKAEASEDRYCLDIRGRNECKAMTYKGY